MTEQATVSRPRWRPPTTSLVAGALVVAGFLLTSFSWWFLLLAALGAFGPGVLRELGLLRDKDELQRSADHRAGYHAVLVTGLCAFVLVAYVRSGATIEHAERLPTLFLALLWFTWLFSSLLSYWGAQKTALRVLVAFGLVWLLFAILSNVGSEWTGWAALLLHPLLALPFFALAWASARWPRVAGVLLIGAGVGFFLFFGGLTDRGPGLVTNAVTTVLFIGPLLACGLSLVASDGDDD